MTEAIYRRLAAHLDALPGGFPATADGLELRILKRLFTPDQARLAVHLNLIVEGAAVVALRAGLPVARTAERLEEMAEQGLIHRSGGAGRPPRYMAHQFVVGIWEYQVDRLDPGLVADMEAYLPHLVDFAVWKKSPQMRVVPVSKSIDAGHRIMAYEQAETILRTRSSIVVSPCICRQERAIAGDGCDRPLETCFSFGDESGYFLRSGIGRKVTSFEALEILGAAERAGLVLQPSNSRDPAWLCCCCACCCGVLRNLNRHPQPARIVSSPFAARFRPEACTGCGACIRRCPMGAFETDGPIVRFSAERCIGCGLCTAACPGGALRLERKPEGRQAKVPATIAGTMLRLGWKRGKIGPVRLGRLAFGSAIDRIRAARRQEKRSGTG